MTEAIVLVEMKDLLQIATISYCPCYFEINVHALIRALQPQSLLLDLHNTGQCKNDYN